MGKDRVALRQGHVEAACAQARQTIGHSRAKRSNADQHTCGWGMGVEMLCCRRDTGRAKRVVGQGIRIVRIKHGAGARLQGTDGDCGRGMHWDLSHLHPWTRKV